MPDMPETEAPENVSADAVVEKLAKAGFVLPKAAAPVAAYVPTVLAGGLLHVSGQLPFVDGTLVKGRLGENVTLDSGMAATIGRG